MKITVGCDLVYLPKFDDSVWRGGEQFLEKLFTAHELAVSESMESLAAIFAVKEAFLKASGLTFSDWKEMEVCKIPSGKPKIHFSGEHRYQVDVSIAHDGDYAMAVVIIFFKCDENRKL